MKQRNYLVLFFLLFSLLLAACGGAAPAPVQQDTVDPSESADADAVADTDSDSDSASDDSTMASDGGMEGTEPYVDHLFATIEDFEAFAGSAIDGFGESPMLAELVASGDLPAVEERLPVEVAVVRPKDEIGQYGGEVRVIGFYEAAGAFSGLTEGMQMGLFMMDPDYSAFHANIARDWELAADGMSLKVHLREGMKWSDGDDFTTEDVQFWHEDILQDPELTPDVEERFKPGGEIMGLNVIDDYTFEFTFSEPYFRAVEVFAGNDTYRPAHALKPYMPKYSDGAEALAEEEGYEGWQAALQFHAGTSDDYYDRDPSMPTLNPWVIKDIGADSVLWERNPYYWRVDTAGNQLPYIDQILVIMTESANATAPVMSLAGELDINGLGLALDDFPVYKQREAEGGYKVYLRERLDQSHALGFAFNFTHKDPILRELFNDLRFRQAMSLAINRNEIAENVFLGQVRPYTAPVSPVWSGYEDWMGNYFGEYDVEQANALLDEIGLVWDENNEWRLRADGEILSLQGEWATEWLPYTEDVLDLVAIHWAEVGVKFEPKFVAEDPLQTAFVANDTTMGISNSDGGAELLARSNYPIRLMPPWHWGNTGCCPMSSYPWRRWLDTDGAEGEEPPEEIKRVYDLVQQWLATPFGTDEYIELINEVITINVENLYYFGTVSSPPSVVLYTDRMGNAPRELAKNGSWGETVYLQETYFIQE